MPEVQLSVSDQAADPVGFQYIARGLGLGQRCGSREEQRRPGRKIPWLDDEEFSSIIVFPFITNLD